MRNSIISEKEISYMCSKIRDYEEDEYEEGKVDLHVVKKAYREGRLDLLLRDTRDINQN